MCETNGVCRNSIVTHIYTHTYIYMDDKLAKSQCWQIVVKANTQTGHIVATWCGNTSPVFRPPQKLAEDTRARALTCINHASPGRAAGERPRARFMEKFTRIFGYSRLFGCSRSRFTGAYSSSDVRVENHEGKRERGGERGRVSCPCDVGVNGQREQWRSHESNTQMHLRSLYIYLVYNYIARECNEDISRISVFAQFKAVANSKEKLSF